MSNVQKRIEELRAKLHEANEAYYVHDTPTMSDDEFDRLLVELKQLELQHPEYADPNSPTARVGGGLIDGFAKSKHAVKMLSLDNAFTPDEVLRFFGKPVDVVMEPKVDGLSLSLRYQHGRLVAAVTRGNGDEGDVVTENARTIRTIPLVLKEPLTIEVRGEVYLPRTRFEALNAEREAAGEDLFANPRNAASGTMKLKDSKEVAKRKLGFCAYRLIDGPSCLETETETLEFLKGLGFETPLEVPVKGRPDTFCAVKYISAEENWVDTIKGELVWLNSHRDIFEYDIDGAVFKVDDLHTQSELADGTKAPKWAVAFKYPPERKATRLLDIILTVGRTGQITPNAVLQPVQLGGSTVKAASLCNADEIARLGIAIGDIVLVGKSAEIIPKCYPYPEGRIYTCPKCGFRGTLAEQEKKHAKKIVEPPSFTVPCGGNIVELARDTWKMPEHCPSCSSVLTRRGVHTFCPNPTCPAQVQMRIKHATAKSALDWDGMGDAQILALYSQGFSKLSDLFTKEPVGLTPGAAKKFAAERERVKKAPLWRKLVALGIEGVGSTLCKELAAKYRSIEAIAAVPRTELVALLGPVNYASLVKFIEENAEEIERLVQAGVVFEEAGVAGPLSGKEFVITGTLMSGTRSQVAARIEAAGGLVKGSVSRKTDYLVVGTGGGANKAAGAAKYGTICLTEEELYKLLGMVMPIVSNVNNEYEF
jgi:DNA ligase (NAD+)